MAVATKPTRSALPPMQPTIEECQNCDENEPEFVVEYGNVDNPAEPTNAYVCSDCLPLTVSLALEIRVNEVELEKHECNAVRVAAYLPDNPTIPPDSTIG